MYASLKAQPYQHCETHQSGGSSSGQYTSIQSISRTIFGGVTYLDNLQNINVSGRDAI